MKSMTYQEESCRTVKYSFRSGRPCQIRRGMVSANVSHLICVACCWLKSSGRFWMMKDVTAWHRRDLFGGCRSLKHVMQACKTSGSMEQTLALNSEHDARLKYKPKTDCKPAHAKLCDLGCRRQGLQLSETHGAPLGGFPILNLCH